MTGVSAAPSGSAQPDSEAAPSSPPPEPGPCPWPSNAPADIREAATVLELRVREDGSIAKFSVLSESLPGLGAETHRCLVEKGGFESPRDVDGNVVSRTMTVRITYRR